MNTVPEPIGTNEIVVGIDASPAAAAALRWAAGQSRATGAPLHVVHSWQMNAVQVESATPAFVEVSVTDARARATRWVLDALGDDAASLPWVLDVAEGPAGQVLVERSRHADSVVLGTGEHVGLRRLLSGSVSHYVLTHAVPPVVAVRAPADAAGHGRRHAAPAHQPTPVGGRP